MGRHVNCSLAGLSARLTATSPFRPDRSREAGKVGEAVNPVSQRLSFMKSSLGISLDGVGHL